MTPREGLQRHAAAPELSVAAPVITFPLAIEENTEFLTQADKLFVLAHLGIPKITADSWSCQVAGMIGSPMLLHYEDLLRFTQRTVKTYFQCAGNPLEPTLAVRQIANLEWRGALLREVLEQAGPSAKGKYLWAFGSDHGEFFGSPHQEHYVKDLPMNYVMSHDVLIATHLNGEPLSQEHGYPARIVAPGFYGTNSVKWLCRLEVSDRRADAYFTKELYNDVIPGGGSKPVWEIEPESIIVWPKSGSDLQLEATEIWGWAWSSVEVDRVEVSVDGGRSWNLVRLDPRHDNSWQRFAFPWFPEEAGRFEILSRVTDSAGRSQPKEGARNSIHRVQCTVVV